MQSTKALNLIVPNRMSLLVRNIGTKSLFSQIVGKINKFVKGSETPYKYNDFVRDQMLKEEKYRNMPLATSKLLFLRDKARKRIVKHNEHVRKLEDKITNKGVYQTQSFANRF